MSDDPIFHDPLIGCLDAAAEQIRAANHRTYSPREVTDLYPALGALHALFSRFDQLADYLLRTVRDADPVDFRHDEGSAVAPVLTAVADGLDHARGAAARTKTSINEAWAQLSHLALDIPDLVCPECREPAHRGTPTDLTPTQRATGVLPRYRHGDGTQLCPVIGTDIDGSGGYQPAPPHAPDSPSSAHRLEPDPEGQH